MRYFCRTIIFFILEMSFVHKSYLTNPLTIFVQLCLFVYIQFFLNYNVLLASSLWLKNHNQGSNLGTSGSRSINNFITPDIQPFITSWNVVDTYSFTLSYFPDILNEILIILCHFQCKTLSRKTQHIMQICRYVKTQQTVKSRRFTANSSWQVK